MKSIVWRPASQPAAKAAVAILQMSRSSHARRNVLHNAVVSLVGCLSEQLMSPGLPRIGESVDKEVAFRCDEGTGCGGQSGRHVHGFSHPMPHRTTHSNVISGPNSICHALVWSFWASR